MLNDTSFIYNVVAILEMKNEKYEELVEIMNSENEKVKKSFACKWHLYEYLKNYWNANIEEAKDVT